MCETTGVFDGKCNKSLWIHLTKKKKPSLTFLLYVQLMKFGQILQKEITAYTIATIPTIPVQESITGDTSKTTSKVKRRNSEVISSRRNSAGLIKVLKRLLRGANTRVDLPEEEKQKWGNHHVNYCHSHPAI